MTTDNKGLLVIGARTLIGRRMPEAIARAGWPEASVSYTSRQPVAGQGLILDTERPEAFSPDCRFPAVIVCAPIWLITDALLERLVDLGMKRLIAFSSTSRLTKATSAEPAERDVVARLAAGEQTVSTFCQARGVAWTILRPTLIYDEGADENVSRIADTIRKLGFFPVCGLASGLRQPVHARELAQAAMQALTARPAYNTAYNLSGGEDLSYADMVRRIFEAMGRAPVIVALPEILWRLGFLGLNLVRPRRLKRNVHMALRMNVDLWFDHSAATRDFGYAPGRFHPDFSAIAEADRPI
ncbi:epimerase [Asticcacaulis sp. 201]|uniref:NAD-dependent epimerase/dehydratase family protein n=1 Tax=Asticcacaulis sp. 201 TaxID=3028787 RepID=UPI00291613A3|nr:epimerase [Asticcacaulis sp. 201]MDV6332977.1 epimerase [Asticcacaulis sp. 201]